MGSIIQKKALTVTTLLALVVAALALSGCSLIGEPEYTTLTDEAGAFHIKIPADWSGEATDMLMTVTAADEMPSTVDTVDNFWLLIYPSAEASQTPIENTLPELVETRAQAREWQDSEFGEIEESMIGSRDAVVMTASGENLDGVPFDALYYLVRSQDRDIIISAIAPAGTMDEYSEELDSILTERWFWHGSPDSSDETSDTEIE